MFHPVGSQPPSVYWRRRLLAVGGMVILVVLIAVTVSTLTSSNSGTPSAGSSGTRAAPASGTTSPTTRTTHPASSSGAKSSSTGSTSSTSPSGSATGTGSTTVRACRTADLKVAAVVKQQTYRVGQDPMVGLQVTNVGSAPCAQNLDDKQVVLKVYNGVSRVWGSHDCHVQSGSKILTLAVGAPVLASVSWSGETSQPNCAGTRQHVGAGTYTLYASLSGKTGTAARFTIT